MESAEQYGGGSGGAGAITLPSALAASYSTQLNLGSGGLAVPTPHQDLVAKVAFDPQIGSRTMHLEFAGVFRRFEFYNPLNQRSFPKAGGGGSINLNLELVRNLRLFGNSYVSNGGGRYIFGQGPDLIIRGDGSPSLIHAYATVDGIEFQARPATMLFGYYGGGYFQRNVTVDPVTGGPVGYGYTGSPSLHNRAIQEVTAGVSHLFWKNPNYGALMLKAQFSWLSRNPWYVAPGEPGSANLNMMYLNLRYTLPGAPPQGARTEGKK
jgi:hypothetical protein